MDRRKKDFMSPSDLKGDIESGWTLLLRTTIVQKKNYITLKLPDDAILRLSRMTKMRAKRPSLS